MLARFGLLVWPETGGKWKNEDRIPDGPAKAAAFGAFDQLDALEAFADWRCCFEASLRSGDLYPALESHLAKYRKLVPALALVFHLADGHRGPVGFASTLRALHWSAYLETHARRCDGVAQDGEADTGRRILERIINSGSNRLSALKPSMSQRQDGRQCLFLHGRSSATPENGT